MQGERRGVSPPVGCICTGGLTPRRSPSRLVLTHSPRRRRRTAPAAHGVGAQVVLRGLVARLVRRGFGGSVVLEQWPWPPELLVGSRDRLLGLWDAVARSESPVAASSRPARHADR